MAMKSLASQSGKVFRANIAGQGMFRSDTLSFPTERGRNLDKLRIKAVDDSDNFKQNGSESSNSRKAVKKAGPKDLGCHPFEEISSKNDKIQKSEIQLSPAAFARTIAETNKKCVVFSSTLQDDQTFLPINADLIVLHNGELFLELGDNSDLIRNSEEDQPSAILVGYGDVGDVSISDVIESDSNWGPYEEQNEEEEGIFYDESDPSFFDDSDEVDVITVDMLKDQFGEDWRNILESLSPEGRGALGAWGGPETLLSVYPWDFALELSNSVLSDPIKALNFPKKRLLITGVVKKASVEDERRILNSWDKKYSSESDVREDKGLLKGPGDSSTLLSEFPLEGFHVSSPLKEGKMTLSETVLIGPGGSRYIKVQGLDSFLPLHSDGVPLEDSENLLGNEDIVELLGSYPEASNDLQVEGNVAEEDSDSLKSFQAFLDAKALKEGSIGFTVGEEGGKEKGFGLASGEFAGEEEVPERKEGNERGEGEEENFLNPDLYKVKILTVVLSSTNGIQESVEPNEWYSSSPHMLAQSASTILKRANRLKRARRCMADLVLREHSLAVEDAYMVGIDHLGIDVRVKIGVQLKTFRFPFLHPANSERAAEHLLDELLRPGQGHVGRTSKPRRKKQRMRRVRGRLDRP